jgi:hypothetical protein
MPAPPPPPPRAAAAPGWQPWSGRGPAPEAALDQPAGPVSCAAAPPLLLFPGRRRFFCALLPSCRGHCCTLPLSCRCHFCTLLPLPRRRRFHTLAPPPTPSPLCRDLFGTGVQGSVPAAWCKAPFAVPFFTRCGGGGAFYLGCPLPSPAQPTLPAPSCAPHSKPLPHPPPTRGHAHTHSHAHATPPHPLRPAAAG